MPIFAQLFVFKPYDNDTLFQGKPLSCANNPCKNGGVCTDVTTAQTGDVNIAFQCGCSSGFQGTRCEIGERLDTLTPGFEIIIYEN
jgi:hypothetical protein